METEHKEVGSSQEKKSNLSPNKKSIAKRFGIPLAAVVIGVVALGVYAMNIPGFGATATADPALATASRAAATVNGISITEGELSGMVNQGLDRAVALDRYINKVVAAGLAQKHYAQESAIALQGAEREVLSQLFVAKRTQDLRTAITAEAVKEFYDKNIKLEDFATFKVKFFLTEDAKQADEVLQKVVSGKAAEVTDKFHFMKDEKTNGGYATAAELPYGLGQVIRQLKVGEYSRPIPLRNGIFVLNLVDTKAGEKPELSKVTADIKEVIVAQKLNDELAAVRSSATINLR